jgi:pilus assembly protein CpaC
LSIRARLIVFFFAALTLSVPLRAASAFEVIPTNGAPLTVQLNQGTLLRLDETPKSVVIADSDIADVSIRSPRLMYVFGKKIGETTLYAVDAKEHVLFNIKIRVQYNLDRLRETLASLVPAGQIQLESVDTGLLLQGTVATAAEAADAVRLAQNFVGKGDIIDRRQITSPNQINLRVRVAEVDRNVIRDLGFNWSAIGTVGSVTLAGITHNFAGVLGQLGTSGQVNDIAHVGLHTSYLDVNAVIDALASQGLIAVLAEPNLTTLSGETASFLAGGQFPVPVPQSGGTGVGAVITIEFKNFGVSLAFTPTLLPGNRISMRVLPEVSQIDQSNAIVINGFSVPGLRIRRADTTVELGSGQSFAIAGLIEYDAQVTNNSVPGLGDIPVIGDLFKSDRFQRNQSELVIIVTPYIVSPVSGKLAAPTDAVIERTSPPGPAAANTNPPPAPPTAQNQKGGLAGPAGFGIE